MTSAQSHKDLLARLEELVFSLKDEKIRPFHAAWPPIGPARRLRALEAVCLPVLRWLPSAPVPAAPGDFGAALMITLHETAALLRWRQTYTADQASVDFLRRYGYTALVGPDGLLASNTIACGLLLLGPATLYPRHRHEAEEIYVILSGNAEWLQRDRVWRGRRPGEIVHHASGEPHAMRTSDHALLALYLWRSADLNQKAELE